MIDLYSSPSPNGRKISIMLEELSVEYNPIFINLEKKEQFTEEFSKISPSNKIPVIVDKDNDQVIFESGAILLYLAKKYNKFLNEKDYWEIIQWVFFQMSYVGPMLGQAHQYLFYNPGKSKFAEEKTRGYTKHIYILRLPLRLIIIFFAPSLYGCCGRSGFPPFRFNSAIRPFTLLAKERASAAVRRPR